VAELVIYSKPGCHLCGQVKSELAKLRGRYPFQLREVNIEENSDLLEEYKEKIPVVFVNGRKAFEYRRDAKTMAKRVEVLLAEERKLADGA